MKFLPYYCILLWALLSGAALGQQALIQNGNMEAGTEIPEHWGAQGAAKIARDTVVFKSGSASMRIDWENGSGGAFQRLEPFPCGGVTVKGSAKVEGQFEIAQVALQLFDASRKPAGWKIVKLLKPEANWTDFSASITSLPPNAASALLVVAGKGCGRIWLDDLSVEGTAASSSPDASKGAEAAATPVPEAAPLPMAIPADDARLQYIGRFDGKDPKAPRCSWPASAVTLRFKGTAANVCLNGGANVRWQVIVDGTPGPVLVNNGKPQTLSLLAGAPQSEHTVTLLKRTESLFGIAKITGFQLNEGAELLKAAPLGRAIEVIGDSISAGYGNEAANQYEKFSPMTENAGIAYGALAARALKADYVCIAWSGKKLWPDNAIPDLYDRSIPTENGSTWDFTLQKPDVVVINLGTNDFSPGNPAEEEWVKAYKIFIGRIRSNYPEAYIFCAVSPMISDAYSKSKNARTTITAFLNRVVTECQSAGEKKIALVEFPMQTGALGFGAAWHPSARQHEAMAGILEKEIRTKLGW